MCYARYIALILNILSDCKKSYPLVYAYFFLFFTSVLALCLITEERNTSVKDRNILVWASKTTKLGLN